MGSWMILGCSPFLAEKPQKWDQGTEQTWMNQTQTINCRSPAQNWSSWPPECASRDVHPERSITRPWSELGNHSQWEFQDTKMELPTIYKAYVSEYHHQIWPLYGTVPPF